ncbi:MAG: HD domain-containing phosphohydrolase [Planctomycetota bacterium]
MPISSQTEKKQTPVDDQCVYLSVDQLKVGVACSHALYDEQDQLLLGAGTRITSELIQGLKDRNIRELAVSPADARLMESGGPSGKRSRPAPRRTTHASRNSGDIASAWRKGVPLKSALVNRHDEPLDEGRREKLHEHVQVAHERIESLRDNLIQEKMRTIEAMQDLSSAFAMAMVDDHDQTVGELVRPAQQFSLIDRSVRLAVLGMAVATELELDGPNVLEVGTAGLLHDIGLFKMAPEFSDPGRERLTNEQMWEYRKHPLVSSAALKDVSDVPNSVLISIEQVHEQFDGSGYPFAMDGKRAHVYARILNVCDTYLQLTIGTKFRKPLVPHDALGLILHQARFGLFDPKVVHAFLRTESLFPLGSRVELSTGQVADVIRRPLHGYATPVVQEVGGDRISMENQSIQIVRPVCDDESGQMRLTVEEMQTLRWNPADELIIDDQS